MALGLHWRKVSRSHSDDSFLLKVDVDTNGTNVQETAERTSPRPRNGPSHGSRSNWNGRERFTSHFHISWYSILIFLYPVFLTIYLDLKRYKAVFDGRQGNWSRLRRIRNVKSITLELTRFAVWTIVAGYFTDIYLIFVSCFVYMISFYLKGEFSNLKSYCERMRDTFWPDWDRCLNPPRTSSS